MVFVMRDDNALDVPHARTCGGESSREAPTQTCASWWDRPHWGFSHHVARVMVRVADDACAV